MACDPMPRRPLQAQRTSPFSGRIFEWNVIMRNLNTEELKQVVGGCGECGCEYPPPAPEKVKNNNGFGNGPDITGTGAPGNSGTNGSPNAAQKFQNDGR